MIQIIIYGLIFLGAALMVYNIIGFIKYALYVKDREKWEKGRSILYIPIVLLCMFLLGYILVGLIGSPDMIMAGILFGGSIFVFVMLRLLNRITQKIIESEHLETRLLAAEESNRAKNAFLASISHEMRTPMNVILGLDELALKRKDIPDETRIQLEKIGKSGNYLLRLINNTLDMQNIEADNQRIKSEKFSLREVISQIESIILSMCEEKGLKFKVSIDEDINDKLIGDYLLLTKALMNILDNAVKYTSSPGDVLLLVEKSFSNDKETEIKFVIKDTGIGISPEFIPKVFEIFSREDESFTNKYGGSGMGLALTKQEIELLKGNIDVSSDKGVGSSFTVTVSFDNDNDESETSAPADDNNKDEVYDSSLTLEEGTILEGYKILVVEDVLENAEIVMDLLELESAEVYHAENGLIALEMFKVSEPFFYDAILMDLRMPVMDGIEAAKKIRSTERKDSKEIPIIALTANAFDTDIKNSKEAGMDVHLVKPIDSDALYKVLKMQIEKAKGRKSHD